MSLPYVHIQPCGCVCCEAVRVGAFRGKGLYRAIPAHHQPTVSGTTTWTLKRFEWGFKVPPGELVWVEREVKRAEKGGHLDAVVIWLVESEADFERRSDLCTSKRWLVPA